MLSFLPSPIKGFIGFILFFANIIIMPLFIIFFGFLKWITPFKQVKKIFWYIQNKFVPSLWIDINSLILVLTTNIKWNITNEGNLKPDHWYFLVANHRSWADIVILQKVFNRKIPTLKFFLKQELLWTLPFGGLSCWMLGFPFMKRHSKAYLKKHPEMKGKDIETTRKACENYKHEPTVVVNFLEGTRFNEKKHKDRASPYKNLLRPKAGGFAFVTSTLKDYMHELIDVTIVYSGLQTPTFWDFLSGKVNKVTVHYRIIPIPNELNPNYHENIESKRAYQNWINNIWQEKDSLISDILAQDHNYEYQQA